MTQELLDYLDNGLKFADTGLSYHCCNIMFLSICILFHLWMSSIIIIIITSNNKNETNIYCYHYCSYYYYVIIIIMIVAQIIIQLYFIT